MCNDDIPKLIQLSNSISEQECVHPLLSLLIVTADYGMQIQPSQREALSAAS
jgi:hypothetical protein